MSRFINPVPQYWLDNGTIASSGKMVFFENKDYSTKKNTYSQSDNTIANTNPVTLDGQGRMPPCFGDGLYSVKFYAFDNAAIDKLGTLQWTRDDVSLSELTGQFSTYSPLEPYFSGDIVRGTDGKYYRSLVGSNKANDPTVSPVQWEEIIFITVYNANRTYQINDNVVNAGLLYRCNTANLIGVAPPASQWDSLTFNGVVSGNLSVSGNVAVVGSMTAGSYLGGNLSKTTDNGITSTVRKQTGTARVSTTTMTSDPDLILTGLTTGADYHIKGHINWTGNASTVNGLKFAIDYTAGLTRSIVCINTIGTSAATLESSINGTAAVPAFFIPTVASSYNQVLLIDAHIRLDTGTTIFLTWAQQVSGATATTVTKGYLTATKLA